MDCHTVHVYVGCGGGFVYSEHAPSYLLESYTVLLSCGFLNLFEVFYLASANQLFPSDYCYTVEKYMWKLWVCSASDPPTSPSCPSQQVPGEMCSPSVLERIDCVQVPAITIFTCHFTPSAVTPCAPDVFSPLGCLQAQTWLFSRLHLGFVALLALLIVTHNLVCPDLQLLNGHWCPHSALPVTKDMQDLAL